jgi:hypothetical protein
MCGEERYSEGSQLIREIVNYPEIPSEIMSFWDRLTRSAQNGEAMDMISVLNGMSQRGLPKGIDFMTWFEIFRDIYIMRSRDQESQTMPVKVPRFTTFDRSFEQLAFLPEFWFGKSKSKPETDNGIKKVLKQSESVIVPSDLLLSFERYMYNQEGGACWGALDWAMAKYCFLVVCKPAGEEDPLKKIASLLLTAHYISNGKMGLYISERGEVELPYIGIFSGGNNTSPLLKYYHFDRFTRFSFIREHELVLDAGKQSTYPRLEPQWQSLAAMTEFILQNKAARATRPTCTRVGFNSFISQLHKLRSENALGNNEQLKGHIDRALELLDSPDFADIPPYDLLQKFDVKHPNIISCDYYLGQQGIKTAEQFWQIAGAVFHEIQQDYENLYYSTVEKFTAEEYARSTNALIQDDCTFLMQSLKGNPNELLGRLKGARLRAALKTLLVTEQLELNCGQLFQILHEKFNSENLILYMPVDFRETAIPQGWLVADVTNKQQAVPTLQRWANEILSEFSRDPKTGTIIRDFTKFKLDLVSHASDKLWKVYFDEENEDICRDRWMLSLADAIRILNDETDKLRGVALPTGEKRKLLLASNRRELETLSNGEKFDPETVRQQLAKSDAYTISKVRQGYLRSLVIMDLIARLMTVTARIQSLKTLWSCPDELETFFTHLLSAGGGDLKLPLPFHVGIYSDSLLRMGRNGNQDGRDTIHRLLNHRYDNAGERYFFLLMLLKYLKETDDPRRVLDDIVQTPEMAEYASKIRLEQLKDYLGGK